MRRRPELALVLLACAWGCGARDNARRARVWTLFEIAAVAAEGGNVAVGSTVRDGIPASHFLTPRAEASSDGGGPEYELTVLHGFLDGLPMTFLSTELWENVDQLWAQPLYRAMRDDGVAMDDPMVREPWVFGMGPDGLFYSPFWQVFGFRVPPGADVTGFLDTRSVLAAAAQTGGLRMLQSRITTLVPPNVRPPAAWIENTYYDDTAAWDGSGGKRYVDVGPGRFDVDPTALVRESPIFLFARRDDNGMLAPVPDWPNVGGSRALFSIPPTLPLAGTGSDGGGAGPSPALPVDPVYGALWRIHLVEVPDRATLRDDQRVVANGSCLQGTTPCLVLDSQTAIESLGASFIHRTEIMASCPLLQLGDTTYPRPLQNPPQPPPSL